MAEHEVLAFVLETMRTAITCCSFSKWLCFSMKDAEEEAHKLFHKMFIFQLNSPETDYVMQSEKQQSFLDEWKEAFLIKAGKRRGVES